MVAPASAAAGVPDARGAARRLRRRVYLFPLGPTEQLGEPWTAVAVAAGALVLAGAVALVLRRAPERSVPAIGAIVTALALGGAMLGATNEWARGTLCANTGARRVLRERCRRTR